MSRSPILDLEQLPPEPSYTWMLRSGAVLLGVLIGGVLARGPEFAWRGPGFNGLLLIPALYVSIAVHETGHFVAGRLAGIESGGIAVGGFVFLKSGRNWIFRFDWNTLFAGFFKPLTGTAQSRPSRYAYMVAGGPLASILLTAVCGIFFGQRGSGAANWLGTLFWTAALTTVASVAPLSAGLNKSDGARLWQFVRYPERARAFVALLAIQTEETRGVRPREWDTRSFEQMLAIDASASEYPYCQLMAFYRRADEGDEPAALEHLEQGLSASARAGKPMRHALFVEAASASANLRKNAAQARTWCERAARLQKPDALDVVEAGIASCEGRYDDAIAHWESAQERVARRRLDSGLIRFAREKWAEYEAACRQSRGQVAGG